MMGFSETAHEVLVCSTNKHVKKMSDKEDEIARKIKKVTRGREVSEMSDDEYTRQLEEELADEPKSSKGSNSYYFPQTKNSVGISASSGTYASPPPGRNFSNSPVHSVEVSIDPSILYDSVTSVVSPSIQYGTFLDIQRRAFTVKLMSVIVFFFAIYGLIFREWYVSLGIIFGPVGYYGAQIYSKNLLSFYLVFLSLDFFAEFAYVAVWSAYGLAVAFSVLVIVIQLIIVYYTFQFYKLIPREGRLAFQEFLNEPGTNSINLQTLS